VAAIELLEGVDVTLGGPSCQLGVAGVLGHEQLSVGALRHHTSPMLRR
jgi:hypothetical protein